MVRERSWTYRIVDILIYLVLGLILVACLVPFVHVIMLSISSRTAVMADRVQFLPVGFTLDNYAAAISKGRFMQALGMSLVRVGAGVVLTLIVTAITAYPLALERIPMPGRKVFMLVLIFTYLFQVGLIPRYLSYKSLGLVDNFLVLILPLLLAPMNVILLINFFRTIPYELIESAMLDGANHGQILAQVMLPLAKPALATVTLFTVVQHWNAWFDGVVYLRDTRLWPLQTYLYSMLTSQEVANEYSSARFSGLLPNVSPKGAESAMILFAIVPILFLYPLLQNYFISGMTLGSVKE